MKKVLLIISIALFAMCYSCSKEENPNVDPNNSGQNGGGNGGGQNGGGSTNPLDFDFYAGFDSQGFWETALYDEQDHGFTRSLCIMFGTDPGLFSRGITEFAVGVQCLDGSIIFNNPGWSDNVYVTKKGNLIWYTGKILNDNAQSWQTAVHFYGLSSATVKLKWTFRVKYNGSYYFEGERWHTENYPGVPYYPNQ